MPRKAGPPTTTLRLPVELVARLDAIAEGRGLSRADALRALLDRRPHPGAAVLGTGKRVSSHDLDRQGRLNAGKG